VFYSVREKNFDDRGARRQADREFSRRAELETEMAKQREYVRLCVVLGPVSETELFCRNAKKAEEDALAVKAAAASAPRIAVPGTPRHVGVGSGSRITATPRKRLGI
jgi:pre-mRNA-splicing factor ATP-dependent RNA helicase DHX38/PRP16